MSPQSDRMVRHHGPSCLVDTHLTPICVKVLLFRRGAPRRRVQLRQLRLRIRSMGAARALGSALAFNQGLRTCRSTV